MIDFNIPPYTGKELAYIEQAVQNHRICGDGEFTNRCSRWMENKFRAKHVLMTTSCSHALDMSAILVDIQPGDEVIMPSYTFVSSANAFVLRGAKIVFVDIDPGTMNLDENLVQEAVTGKTRVIVPVHYGGVSCNMDVLMKIAKKYQIVVVEDAAQGVNAFYKGRALGTIGDFGCYSFHETKNYSMGEGGALVYHSEVYNEKAEILREKGTDRSKFFRKEIDKYTWVDMGSSYLPSDLNCAYLWAQLTMADVMNENRRQTYYYYDEALKPLAVKGVIEQPYVPGYAVHNGHMYYIKAKDMSERTRLIRHLKEDNIQSVFHYIPLHTSPAGKKFGRFHGNDKYTTKESERLLRLPMYYNISKEDREKVVESIYRFYK